MQNSIVLITQSVGLHPSISLASFQLHYLSASVCVDVSTRHIIIECDSVENKHSSADTDLGTPGFSATMDQKPSEDESDMTDCLKQASNS